MGSKVLQTSEESGGFSGAKARLVIQGHRVPERDSLLTLKKVPVDVKKVEVRVRLVFTGYPRTGDELYSANNVALTSPKMLGSLIHTDFPAIQHIGNQGEEHQKIVGGGGSGSRLSHDEPPPCAGEQ